MITQTYNLIILDRSGSMISIKDQAIAGVNETIGTIRSIAKKNKMTQLLTLSTFCSCSMSDLCHNVDIEQVKTVSASDYEPCCCTPLFDAIGRCCTRLRAEIGDRDDVAVSVTIITDGYENDSHEWTAVSIKQLIESLKSKGWLFAYIGANQNLEGIKYSLSIDNTLSFEATPEGTKNMFRKERDARKQWSSFMACCDKTSDLSKLNDNYFDNSGFEK